MARPVFTPAFKVLYAPGRGLDAAACPALETRVSTRLSAQKQLSGHGVVIHTQAETSGADAHAQVPVVRQVSQADQQGGHS